MTGILSDESRLWKLYCGDSISGMDRNDLWYATSLCQPVGPKLQALEDKLNPIVAIERLCKVLTGHANTLAKLKSDQTGAPIRAKGAVPASTISFVAWEMLARCHNYGIAPPVALLKLVRLQLVTRSEQTEKEEKAQSFTFIEVCLFSYHNPDFSLRKISKHFDVDVSTISRWDKKFDLKYSGEKYHVALINISGGTYSASTGTFSLITKGPAPPTFIMHPPSLGSDSTMEIKYEFLEETEPVDKKSD